MFVKTKNVGKKLLVDKKCNVKKCFLNLQENFTSLKYSREKSQLFKTRKLLYFPFFNNRFVLSGSTHPIVAGFIF
jgi:hypothetical protein